MLCIYITVRYTIYYSKIYDILHNNTEIPIQSPTPPINSDHPISSIPTFRLYDSYCSAQSSKPKTLFWLSSAFSLLFPAFCPIVLPFQHSTISVKQ